jgi:hypothetical protein
MLHVNVSDREQISALGTFLTLVLALAAGLWSQSDCSFLSVA